MATDNDDDKDIDVVFSPQVLEQMAKDEDLAKAMREIIANMRQAHEAVKRGQYDSFDDAMEAITGQRPTKVNFDDEDDDD